MGCRKKLIPHSVCVIFAIFAGKFKSKKHRSVRMKTFSLKTSRQKGRRVFAAMENLDNLSVNTRRFLSRSLMIQKWNDDESRIRKFVKPLKRRSSGNSSLSGSKTVLIVRDAPTIVSEEVLSELDDSNSCVADEETILHERETEEKPERSFEVIENNSVAQDESQCRKEPTISDETENQNCNDTTEESPIRTEDDIVAQTVKSLVSENKLSDAFSSYKLRYRHSISNELILRSSIRFNGINFVAGLQNAVNTVEKVTRLW